MHSNNPKPPQVDPVVQALVNQLHFEARHLKWQRDEAVRSLEMVHANAAESCDWIRERIGSVINDLKSDRPIDPINPLTLLRQRDALREIVIRFLSIDDWSDESIAPADLITDANNLIHSINGGEA